MKKFYFSLIVLFMSFTNHCTAQCPGGSQTISGDNLTIGAGNWCLPSGTYTGNISGISPDAIIYIANGANFKPGNLNGGLNGTLYVYGETTLPGVSMKSNFKLRVYGKATIAGVTVDGANVDISNSGTFNLTGNINFNGGSSSIIRNNPGAAMMLITTSLGANTIMDNSGTLKVSGDFSLNESTSTFYNRNGGVVRVSNNFNPKGKVLNDGLLVVSDFTNVNTATMITNNCRFVSVNGLNNNGPSYFTNNGLLWTPNGKMQNNSGATIELGGSGIMRGTDFGNDGVVRGSGKMYYTNSTTHQNQASFTGISSISPIIFYDATRTGNQMFDIQTAAFSNTVRAYFTPADTTNFDCTGLVLPVQISSFEVQVLQRKSVLISWQSRTEVNLSRFVIERSSTISSNTWETIGTVAAAGNSTSARSYQFTENNPPSGISYYRLRSIDADGKESISETRQINLDPKASSLQVYPTLVPKGGLVKVITTKAMRYQLLDMSGKTVLTGTFISGANTLTLSLNAGNYIIQTPGTDNMPQHNKIIVQ